MGRKRIEIGPAWDAKILAGIQRGESAQQVARMIGGGISVRTVGRRMRELRGPLVSRAKVSPVGGGSRPETPAAPDSAPLPSTPEDIPEGASLKELHELMRRCKDQLSAAEGEDNGPLAGQMIRVAASLAETIRKATPPTPEDPNDQPDMVALGAEVQARLLKAIDLVVEAPVESWGKETSL